MIWNALFDLLNSSGPERLRCIFRRLLRFHLPRYYKYDERYHETFISYIIISGERSLIDKWPNSYAYTKAITESTVRQYNTEFPTCIVRPSIIASTFKEPLNGWINNLYGSIGVVMGSALGVLRTLHCVPDNLADIVPADYVIANIIAAGWDTAKRK